MSASPAVSSRADSAVGLGTASFLAIESSYPSDAPNRYQLQIRSARDGSLHKTLLTVKEPTALDALVEPGGSVLAVLADFDACSSMVERINPASGRTTPIRTLHLPVFEASLSPNGKLMAYVAWAREAVACAHGKTPAADGGGGEFILQQQIGVINLGSGATLSRFTTKPGFGLGPLAWNPQGTELVAEYSADPVIWQPRLVLLDPTHLNPLGAARIVAPAGCGYTNPVWATTGILTVEDCNPQRPDLSLVNVATDGRRSASWSLPACADSVELVLDQSQTRALLNVSQGDDASPRTQCQRRFPGTRPDHSQIDLLKATTLQPIMTTTSFNILVSAASW